jgi:hypothetical protein
MNQTPYVLAKLWVNRVSAYRNQAPRMTSKRTAEAKLAHANLLPRIANPPMETAVRVGKPYG